MTLKDQLDTLLDATAFDSTGTKIGVVRQVYVDDASGKITFATVSTGIFSSDAIVPLHGARLLGDELHVDHTRAVIRDSPRPDHTEDALTPEQEVKLLEYYGIEAPVRGHEPVRPASTADRNPPAKKAPEKRASPGTGPVDEATPGKSSETKTGTKTGTKPEGTTTTTSSPDAGPGGSAPVKDSAPGRPSGPGTAT